MSRSAIRRWFALLFLPVDAASLAVFRIVLGVAVATESLLYLHAGWVDVLYMQPTIHFTYLHLDFVHPWPGPWMHVHFWVMTGLGLLFAAGCWYRVSSALLFVAYTYVFLLEQAAYMNHHYLIVLLTFLLMLMPAERAYSLDRLRNRRLPTTVPRWNVWILRYQLALVYLFGGVAKLNADWLHGEPMHSILSEWLVAWPTLSSFVPATLIAYLIAYGGIVTDFAIPMLLCVPRTFRVGFVAAVIFHGLNAVFLRIGVFSYLMVGAILIFLPPDWPRRLRVWLARPQQVLRSPTVSSLGDLSPSRWGTALFIHLYVLAQLLIPLRHLLYPGPVAWSEEGHRFAWRMMLRNKRSEITITALDPATGQAWSIDPSQDLTARQLAKLQIFPDILLQYVHHHRDRLRREGVANPVIHVHWLCSLNGGPPRPLVDPSINLAAEPRTLRPARWIRAPE